MIFFPPRKAIRSAPPARISLAGLAEIRLTSTLPPSHAAAARLRLLKKRPAPSHLSTRTWSMRLKCTPKLPSPGGRSPARPARLRRYARPREGSLLTPGQLSCPLRSARKLPTSEEAGAPAAHPGGGRGGPAAHTPRA